MKPGSTRFRKLSVVIGAILAGIGALFAVTNVGLGVMLLLAPKAPQAPIDFMIAPMGLALGLPLFFWGRSVMRRARNDDEIVGGVGFGAGTNRRGLAWAALVFSFLATAFLIQQLVTGKPLGTAAASGFLWFPAIFVSAVRYLRRRAPG